MAAKHGRDKLLNYFLRLPEGEQRKQIVTSDELSQLSLTLVAALGARNVELAALLLIHGVPVTENMQSSIKQFKTQIVDAIVAFANECDGNNEQAKGMVLAFIERCGITSNDRRGQVEVNVFLCRALYEKRREGLFATKPSITNTRSQVHRLAKLYMKLANVDTVFSLNEPSASLSRADLSGEERKSLSH